MHVERFSHAQEILIKNEYYRFFFLHGSITIMRHMHRKIAMGLIKNVYYPVLRIFCMDQESRFDFVPVVLISYQSRTCTVYEEPLA